MRKRGKKREKEEKKGEKLEKKTEGWVKREIGSKDNIVVFGKAFQIGQLNTLKFYGTLLTPAIYFN